MAINVTGISRCPLHGPAAAESARTRGVRQLGRGAQGNAIWPYAPQRPARRAGPLLGQETANTKLRVTLFSPADRTRMRAQVFPARPMSSIRPIKPPNSSCRVFADWTRPASSTTTTRALKSFLPAGVRLPRHCERSEAIRFRHVLRMIASSRSLLE